MNGERIWPQGTRGAALAIDWRLASSASPRRDLSLKRMQFTSDWTYVWQSSPRVLALQLWPSLETRLQCRKCAGTACRSRIVS